MAATLKALDMQIEGTSIRLPSHADIVDGLGTFVDGKINTFSSTKVVPALNGLSDLYLGKNATAAKATADANGVNIANNYLKASVAASTYLGKSAEASIATKARQDGDGNVISSTYLKSATAANTYLKIADEYTHPNALGRDVILPLTDPALVQGGKIHLPYIEANAQGHVTALSYNDITLSVSNASTTKAGLMSAEDKIKLNGISAGAGGSTTLAAAATKLATARYISGISFDGTANISFGALCTTGASTAAKVADFADGGTFVKKTGAIIAVSFNHVNTAENITLNLSGTGDLPVYRDNARVSGAFTKNSYGVVLFKYCVGGHTGDNSQAYWQIVEPSLDVGRANAGTLSIARGGTGATTAALARASLGAAASDHTHTDYAASSHNHAASAINSGVLPVARGGTGASTTALALATLGAAAANHTHSGYAATSHTHAAGDIASGTLAVARGGTGQTSLDSVVVGKAKTLNTARYIDGVGFDGSANISHGAICSTAAATVAKVADFSDGGTFAKRSGTVVSVLFAYVNTAENITLNLGGTGALPVYRDNVKVSGAFTKNTYGVVHLKYCVGGHTGNSSTEYWQIIEPSLDVSRASAGTLPVARGGTGQTSLANVKVGSATAADSLSGARLVNGVDLNYVGGGRIFGFCTTAAATAAKTVTINGFDASKTAIVFIYFTEVNTAANPTLSINGSAAVPFVRYASTSYKTSHITNVAREFAIVHWSPGELARLVETAAPKLLGAITGTPTLTSANERAITTTFVPSVGLRTVSIEVSHSTYQGNLDNMKTSGNYLLQTSANFSSWHKLPSGYSGQNFILEVIGNNTGLIVQRLSAPMVNACFIRFYYVTNTTSTWTKWMKFSGTEVDATA